MLVKKFLVTSIAAVLIVASLSGCTNREAKYTLGGAAVGAIAGGAIGGGRGAVAGGALGAGTGYLLSR